VALHFVRTPAGLVYHYYSGGMNRDLLLTTQNHDVACLIGMSPRYQDGDAGVSEGLCSSVLSRFDEG
jgi:hypothetical protein